MGFERIKKMPTEIHHWLVERCSHVEPGLLQVSFVLLQDVQYADIDYMERQLDFTLSPEFEGLPALITRMKAGGMRVILILVSPCVNGQSLFGRVNGIWCRKLYTCVFFHAMNRGVEVQ